MVSGIATTCLLQNPEWQGFCVGLGTSYLLLSLGTGLGPWSKEYTAMILEQSLMNEISRAAMKPPGYFMQFCSAFYSASHRRGLHDALPTVPVTLAPWRRCFGSLKLDVSLQPQLKAERIR